MMAPDEEVRATRIAKTLVYCAVMKLLRTALLAIAVLALLVPSTGLAGQLPLPLEKKVVPGTSTVAYMGQTFRYTTQVSLLVKFDPVTETSFKMSVVIYPGTPLPSGPSGSSFTTVTIYWMNFGTGVYDGTVPSPEPWTGTFTTEGGFVDR